MDDQDQLRASVDQLGQDSIDVDQDHYEEHSAGCDDDQDSTSQCYRDWSRLADHDALGLIARHLPVVDRIAVSKVCTSWRSVMISVRHRQDQKRRYGLPCLVYMHAKESAAAQYSCRLIDPIHRDNKHTFEDVMARGATSSRILFSRDGWLLLMSSPRTPTINNHEDDRMNTLLCCDVFFLNLSSKSKMELPTLMTKSVHGQFSFSDRPTSPSCVVVAFLDLIDYYIHISFCRPGDTQWTFITEILPEIHLWGCLTNIVWSSGRFYCLDTKGNLGGFDPSRQSWTFVGTQEDLGSRINRQLQQYLVESAGDLLRVCDVGNSVVVVYRFDTPSSRWVRVEDLGDRTLFVGRQNSMSAITAVESMRGKVYFNAVRVVDGRGGEDDDICTVISCSIYNDQSEEEYYCAAMGSYCKDVLALPRRPGASGKWKKFMFSAWVDLEWSITN